MLSTVLKMGGKDKGWLAVSQAAETYIKTSLQSSILRLMLYLRNAKCVFLDPFCSPPPGCLRMIGDGGIFQSLGPRLVTN